MRAQFSIATLLLATSVASLPAQTVAITGGKIYPVSGPVIESGTVLMRDGKIVAVGANVAVPADATRIDATGKVVTPGLVNPYTDITLMEIGAVGATRGASARGHDGVAAAFRPWEGLNPTSIYISPARNAGITSALIAPQGGLIAGQAAVVHLIDGSAADMVLQAPVAMVASLSPGQGRDAQPRAEVLMRLREILDDARVYRTRRADFERAQTRTLAASRLDLAALLPVLDGTLPLAVEVDKASDIEAAMKLAKDYNIKLMIVGGAEAWEVADKLAAARIPVLTGAMNNIPDSFATLGQRQESAGILSKAGVKVSVIGNAGGGDEDAFNVRNVRYEAGNAVAYGMDWNAALRSITLTPAETFGVADRIGSLAPGKIADVVIWSGDPLEISTRVERVFVRGQQITGKSREDMLTDRYKNVPVNYRRP